MGNFKIENIDKELISIALEGIINVEAKLHKICLSGRYNYPRISKRLGGLYLNPNKNRGYGKEYVRQYPGFYLIICVNPFQGNLPRCYIEIHPRESTSARKYKKFLIALDKKLPGLKMSRVEYAIDQYCLTPQTAEILFETEVENLYAPYQRSANMDEVRDGIIYGKKYRLSRVFRIGVNQKIYERGQDTKKFNGGWPVLIFDRVRLEHTASRDELRVNGINTLADFIENPKFFKLNSRKWLLRQFKSKTLPRPWQYEATFQNDYHGSFHMEYRRQRNKVKNITQHIQEHPQLSILEHRLTTAMTLFDKVW